MSQLSLLSYRAPVAAPAASEQDRQLARVGGRIDPEVLAWCRRHVGEEFHLATFTADIQAAVKAAPDSPRRRLLELVKAGHVQAVCVSRGRSLWRIDGVAAP